MIGDYVSEFLGLNMKIMKHSNPNNIGKEGTVAFETARTLVILSNGRRLVIPKETGEFNLTDGQRNLRIVGDLIAMKPEERLKNYRKIAKKLQQREGD